MSTNRNKPPDEQIMQNKLCFEYQIFHSDDFSTSKFLSLFGRNATLEELRSDLNTYLNIVDSSLNDLINADFQDHVTLSSYIVDIFQMLNNTEEPLSRVKLELEKRSADISSVCDELKTLILERNSIEGKRKHQIAVRNIQDSLVQLKIIVEVLDRAIDCNFKNKTRVTDQAITAHAGDQANITQTRDQANMAHARGQSNVTQTTNQANIGHATNDAYMASAADSSIYKDLDAHAQDSKSTRVLFRRAASSINYFELNLENCVNGNLPDTYLKDFNQLKKRIIAHLNEIFMSAYQSKDAKLAKILNIYFTVREEKIIYNFVKERIVSPRMENIICEEYLKNASNDLSIIYDEVILFVDENSQLHSDLELSLHSCAEFDFLLNSVWPCVSRKLINLKLIYVCGNANTFHKRYAMTIKFLEQFEYRLSSIDAARAFRKSDDYKSFIKCWNLSVYYQLRFQEIAGQLEKVIRCKESDFKKHIQMVTDQATLCLSQCWADDVFIREISHKFWRLSLQILSRYRTWCQSVLSEPMDSNNKIKAGMLLLSQCKNFMAQFKRILCLASNKIHSQSAVGDMRKNIEQFESNLGSDLQSAENMMIDLLTNASVEITRQVNDIHRMYRRTNRGTPRDPCPYVGNILAPVIEFKKEYGDAPNNFLLRVVSNLTIKYYERVMELFESMHKTQESLKRFKKIKDPNSTDGTNEDDKKIRMQVAIDVEFYVRLIDTELAGSFRKDRVDKLRDLIECTKK